MKTNLNADQELAIQKAKLDLQDESIDFLLDQNNIKLLSIEQLILVLKIANATYREGYPIIKDEVYDSVFLKELQERDEEHEFLHNVEPEPVVSAKTVALPQKMLSTDKAYSFEEINKWMNRLLKAADEIGFDPENLIIRVTPKLDGFAAYDDGNLLYTRGDGIRGQDISRAFNRGLKVAGNGERGSGPGEIVIKKSYFEEKLSEKFENSRNIQAAIIAEKKIDESIQKAIDDGACVFYPFSQIENWEGHYSELLKDFESICEDIWNKVDFDVDGIILETTSEELKAHMGATRKHHRWQIAFKVNEESAEVKIVSITPQTSRTGRITPVAELEPTKLSGATLSRATAHHYGMVESKGIGAGAVVELVRSGLVIPKIERVITPVEPDLENVYCTSCNTKAVREGDHLYCPNKTNCPAQTENTLIHFFKTLGNVDGFGPKVIEKLHESGINKIHEIYNLTVEDLTELEFGEKTSQNLVDQLVASRTIEIEDWRFLAAFGVTRLGFGNCEKLLAHHEVANIFDVSVEDMIKIDGFAELSAKAIFEGLDNIQEEFFEVYNLSFNLTSTYQDAQNKSGDSPLEGKQVVFTGKMVKGSRGDMEKEAKLLGAKVGKSVTSKTSFLVTGENVGANKINAAKDKGVEVLTESEYLELIAG